ncbi:MULTISPECIES: hypothetical protein [Thiorhodovibrio]|uniref:hypothetical protein n=1 Tax=Thiorhodovibrio TaxID=61593 RepID=UPI001911E6E0|nr:MULTISPECIES: hypothetical protein [Thiorhodovibrio]
MTAEHDGRLTADGPAAAVDSLLSAIRAHKAELLTLLAANDPAPPWQHDADLTEAVEERAGIVEFDGGLSPGDAEAIAKGAAADYYNHLMRQDESVCGCRTNLGALVARFCPEGQRLRDAYSSAASQAEAHRTRRMAP